jgi:tetratricopeptide (TPR) repeat protein
MKRIDFILILVLLVISCNSTRTVIEPVSEITEGEAKIVKLQPDNSQKSSAGVQPTKTIRAPANPSPAVDKNLSPEVKALLEQTRKEEEKTASARQERLKELEAELEKINASRANLEKADACVAEGNKLFADKSYEKAVQKYKEALDYYPLHKEAQTKLTECYRALNATEGEKGEADLASEEERLLLSQKFAAGEQLFTEHNLDEAAAKFSEVVNMITRAKKKLDTQNYLERAKEYLQKIEAEKEAKKQESTRPKKQEEPPQK